MHATSLFGRSSGGMGRRMANGEGLPSSLCSLLQKMWSILTFFGVAAITFSNVCFLQQEQKVGEPVKITNHTLDKAEAPCHPFCIVPHRCESPIRGHFDKIYEKGTWASGTPLRKPSEFYSDAAWPPKEIRKPSASGAGSNLGHATETSLKIIKDTIATFNVKSMIDIPCGDTNWVFDSFETDSLPLYVGLDITGAVIELNK